MLSSWGLATAAPSPEPPREALEEEEGEGRSVKGISYGALVTCHTEGEMRQEAKSSETSALTKQSPVWPLDKHWVVLWCTRGPASCLVGASLQNEKYRQQNKAGTGQAPLWIKLGFHSKGDTGTRKGARPVCTQQSPQGQGDRLQSG